jgi:hypothetical protein
MAQRGFVEVTRPLVFKMTKDFKRVPILKPWAMVRNEHDQKRFSVAKKGDRTKVVSRWSLG